jgi:hypothetical protein
MIYIIYSETLSYRDTRHHQNGVTCVSVMLFVMISHSAFLGLLKTYCTARVSSDWMIMEYTHDEYCDMSIILGACNSRAGTAARYPGRRYPDANMFRRLEQRLRETRNVTTTAHVNAQRPPTVRHQPVKVSSLAAMGREPWRIGTIQTEGPPHFMAMNCGAHICFHTIVSYGCNFANVKASTHSGWALVP